MTNEVRNFLVEENTTLFPMKRLLTFFNKSIFLYLSLLIVSFLLINPPLTHIKLRYLRNFYQNSPGGLKPIMGKVYQDYLMNLESKDARAWSDLGAFQWEKKEFKQAVISYKKALELEPNNLNLIEELKRIQNGSL